MAQKNNVLMEKKGDQVNDQRFLLMVRRVLGHKSVLVHKSVLGRKSTLSHKSI